VIQEALRFMEEQDRLGAAKLDQLRQDIQDGLTSGSATAWDASSLDPKLLQPPNSRLPRKGRSSPRKIGCIFANGLPHLAAAAKFSTAPR
jgi:hypothetical protein